MQAVLGGIIMFSVITTIFISGFVVQGWKDLREIPLRMLMVALWITSVLPAAMAIWILVNNGVSL